MATFILIPGLWLTGEAWSAVTPELTEAGHDCVALTLPGQGDGNGSATYDDQVDAVVVAVDAAPEDAIVVGHSAAATLAWVAADQRVEKVRSVGLIGGFPAADGEAYADFFEPKDGVVPFPGWQPFEGPDADDLDAEARAAFEAQAVTVPEAVTRGTVRLSDDRRYDIPTVVICPEFTPEQARSSISDGDIPELAAATRLEFVDLDSGHWPMFSQPAALSAALTELADPHAG